MSVVVEPTHVVVVPPMAGACGHQENVRPLEGFIVLLCQQEDVFVPAVVADQFDVVVLVL